MLSTERLNSHQLSRAAELLKQGQLVAFPTETVYGLGANIFLPSAVESIFKVKGRPSDNPLIAHVSSLGQIEQIAQDIPPIFYQLAEAFFPGPLTVVLKRSDLVPAVISAGLDTIAVRMPAHPLASQLISLCGTPLVAPSANLSGKPSATQAEHVLEDFEGKIAAVVDGGKTYLGIESTVISLIENHPILLRPGTISQEDLEKVLGSSIQLASSKRQGPALSPGMKYRHYSPQTPIKLFYSSELLEKHLREKHQSRRMLLASRPFLSLSLVNVDHFTLCSEEFYSSLRLADQQNYEEILVFCDESIQQQSGLMNRILHASGSF